MGSGWYYLSNDTRIGPVEGREIERLISQRSIVAHTLVWREGMAGWEEAGRHFAFSDGFTGPPPIPPRAPAAGIAPPVNAVGSEWERGVGGGLHAAAPPRGFGEAISVCFSKYVTFSGRASRSEYWYFFLFSILIGLAASVADIVAFGPNDDTSPIDGITSLVLFLPGLAVGVRRLHDTNRSGWWIGGFWIGLFCFGVVSGMFDAANPYSDGAIGGFTAVFGIGAVIAVIYAIAVLVFFCQRGNPGPNRFD